MSQAAAIAKAESDLRAVIGNPRHEQALEVTAAISRLVDSYVDARATVFGIIDPDYGRIYTIARLLAWQEGYAIALHGSFTRDLDLIAVPWAENACDCWHLVKRIEDATKLKSLGAPSVRPNGRLTWTLTFPAFGDPRFVDLSVMSKFDACPGHVASDTDAKVCKHCGTHVDSMRPEEIETDLANASSE
jgi:hypothetical protein